MKILKLKQNSKLKKKKKRAVETLPLQSTGVSHCYTMM